MFLRALILALTAAALSACGVPAGDLHSSQTEYITNAQHLLQQIETENAAGIVLHLKPRVKASCSHMYAEISHRASPEEPWVPVAAIWPGLKAKENYGERFIENQLQFVSLKTKGEHGVTKIGCKSVSDTQMNGISALLAVFTPEAGRLSYLGELGPFDQRKRFMKIDVVDRSDFALDKIKAVDPGLAPYFKPAVMEKYEPKLPPKLEAAIKNAPKKIQIDPELTRLQKAYTAAKADFKRSQADVDIPKYDPEAFKRNILTVKMAEAEFALSRYKQKLAWEKEGKSPTFIDTAMALMKTADDAEITHDYHYVEHGRYVPKELIPERNKLVRAAEEASEAYNKFTSTPP